MQATTPTPEQVKTLCEMLTEVAKTHSRQMETFITEVKTLTTEVKEAKESAAAALKECGVVRQEKDAAQSAINMAQVVVAAGPAAGSVIVSRVLSTQMLMPGVIVCLSHTHKLVEIVEVKMENGNCVCKGFPLQDATTMEADKGVTRLVDLASGLPIEADAVGRYLLTDLAVDVSVNTIAATDSLIGSMPTYRLVGEGVVTGLAPINWREGDGYLIESSPGTWSLEKAERMRACPLEQEALWFWNRTGPLYAVYREILQTRLDSYLPSWDRGPNMINADDFLAGLAGRGRGTRREYTCSMCKVPRHFSDIYQFQDPTICRGDELKYLALRRAHNTALSLRREGLPLDADLAATFSNHVAHLQELTHPRIVPKTTDTQEESKGMEERKEKN